MASRSDDSDEYATEPSQLSTPISSVLSHEHSTTNEEFSSQLESIRQWFAGLNSIERAAAFGSIAELPTRREIQPLIQLLQHRERKMWRRRQEKDESQGDADKPPLPPFPQDSSDPAWLGRWLRTLRLHKYEKCLHGLRPPDLLKLGDEDFKRLGVDTVGARKKLVDVLNIARAEAEAEDGYNYLVSSAQQEEART